MINVALVSVGENKTCKTITYYYVVNYSHMQFNFELPPAPRVTIAQRSEKFADTYR